MPAIKRSGPPVPIGQNVVRVGSTHRQQHRALYPDKRVWHTDSKGKKDVRLVLQDDRNLVLYAHAAERPGWSSKTNAAEPPPPAPEHIAPKPARASGRSCGRRGACTGPRTCAATSTRTRASGANLPRVVSGDT